MRHIDKIIIHCSATARGQRVTVDQIRGWHTARGWRDIGYHSVILLDGSVHVGRPLDEVGAHTKGYNTNSIGICYVGGVDANDINKAEDTRTPEQKIALRALVDGLKGIFPNATVHGHNEFANKACPSFNVQTEL
jgi:N-acetylmuramoyl-L-alanine amidase